MHVDGGGDEKLKHAVLCGLTFNIVHLAYAWLCNTHMHSCMFMQTRVKRLHRFLSASSRLCVNFKKFAVPRVPAVENHGIGVRVRVKGGYRV